MVSVYQYVRSGSGRENGGQKQQAYMRHDELLRLINLVTALVHKDRKKNKGVRTGNCLGDRKM